MTTVAELFGLLGIETDFNSVATAMGALSALRQATDDATKTAELSAALNHVHGDAKKAAALIGISYDEAGAKAEQAKKRTEAWGKTTAAWGKAARFAVWSVGAAIGAVAALRGLGSIGDDFTGAASKIRGMTDDVEQQKRLQDQLYDSAQLTATGYGEVAGLYQQVGKAAQANGRSLEQAAVLVDTISKGIKASGAPAEGARAALTQFSQALGSGKLRGEEFNSVIEQAPYLIDIIGTSLGKTRGEMRKLAEGGKLTSKVVIEALEKQRGAVDDAFAKRLPQVGDMFTRLRNRVSKELAAAFARPDVARGLESAFAGLSTALVAIVRALAAVGGFFAEHEPLLWVVVAAVAALEAGYIALAIAATAAWIAALSPAAIVAAAIVAIVAAVVVLAIAFRKQLAAAARAVGGAFSDLWRDVKRAAAAAWGAFSAAASAIRGVFEPVFAWFEKKWKWVKDRWEDIKGVAEDVKTYFVGDGSPTLGPNWTPLTGGVNPFDPGAKYRAPVRVSAAASTTIDNITQTANVTINAPAGADAAAFGAAARQGTVDALTGLSRGAKKGVGR